ncbi:MAG: hypothetical protein AABY88_05545, partial [Pseudomonadota bacterium]
MGRIIPICSGIVAAALLTSTGVAARTAGLSPLKSYVSGRMADIDGESAIAAMAYSKALVALPSDSELALRAYRKAIEAGDRGIALNAARVLDVQNALPADAILLLFTERLAQRDWTGGLGLLDRLDPKVGLGFLVPVLRAWTQYGAGSSDPLATLAVPEKDSLILSYAREHRALMLIATGRYAEGQTAVAALASSDARGIALRLAAASQLASKGQKTAALELLISDDSAIRVARGLIEAGKPLGGGVDQAGEGVATLLSGVASDLMRDRATPAALTLARLASFAAPGDDMARLILAQALLANGKIDGALIALRQIKPTS